jgi:hypothetical protein
MVGVVASVGRPEMLNFIFGLVCVSVSIGIVLFMYNYTQGLASESGYIIWRSAEIFKLYVVFGLLLFFGLLGGYEIGRFKVANEKQKVSRSNYP